jgi:hypothetical protein
VRNALLRREFPPIHAQAEDEVAERDQPLRALFGGELRYDELIVTWRCPDRRQRDGAWMGWDEPEHA